MMSQTNLLIELLIWRNALQETDLYVHVNSLNMDFAVEMFYYLDHLEKNPRIMDYCHLLTNIYNMKLKKLNKKIQKYKQIILFYHFESEW